MDGMVFLPDERGPVRDEIAAYAGDGRGPASGMGK